MMQHDKTIPQWLWGRVVMESRDDGNRDQEIASTRQMAHCRSGLFCGLLWERSPDREFQGSSIRDEEITLAWLYPS